MAVVATGTTPDGGTKMSDGTVVYANKKKNVPKVTTPVVSTVNPTTGFDYLKSSFPTASAPTPQYIQTGVGTTSIQKGNVPIAQVKPTLVQAPKITTPVVNTPSNIVKIPEAEGLLQEALQRGLSETTTPKDGVISAAAGTGVAKKNIPKSTTSLTQTTTTVPTIITPSQPTGPVDGTATTQISTISKTPGQIANEKAQELKKMKEADISAKQGELTKGTDVLQTNNKLLMRLYGIDDQGNVDTTNPNGLAAKIEKSKLDYQTQKNQLLGEYSGARLRKVQSQIRQMLTSRGIDITKIPPEQLIQLSGEVGNTAFNDIFTAKEKTVNDILQNGAQAEDKINALREKGMLSQNDLRVSLETLRSKVLGDINNINKQFANDIFGIQDKLTSDKESRKAAAINAITQFGAALGLTGTKLGAITSYINNFSNATDALQAMSQDLNNPASAIYKTVGVVEAANLAARIAEANMAERKLAATELSATASATRAAKTGTDAVFKLTADQRALVSANTGIPMQDVTVDDLNGLIQKNTKVVELLGKGTYTDTVSQ